MDIIYLHGLRCNCLIGTSPWEKQIRQNLLLNLELAVNTSTDDNLDNTVNYLNVAKRVQDFTQQSSCQLIETLANRIAELLLHEFSLSRVRVHIDKGAAITDVQQVGTIVERIKE